MKIILEKLHRLMCSRQCSFAVALATALLLLGSVSVRAAEQKTPEPQKVSAPQAPAAIPMEEVAQRATEVSILLQVLNTQLSPRPQIETIRRLLPDVSTNIALEFSETKAVLTGQPTFAVLQTGQQLWEKRQLELTRWLSHLTERSTQLQASLNKLADLQKTWSQTRDAAKISNAPEAIIQEIDDVLNAIGSAQTPLRAQRTATLELQSRVAQAVALCEQALAEIVQAQHKAVGGLVKREGLPIWSAELWARTRAEGPARVREIAAGQWADIKQYIYDPSKGMPLHIGLLLLVVVLLWVMRRQVRQWPAAGKDSLLAITVFDRPFSAALLVTLFAASSPNILPASPTLRQLFTILELVPMIRLVQPVVSPGMVHGLWVLAFLFTLNTTRDAFAGALLFERAIILLEIVVGIVVLGWSLAFGRLLRSQVRAKESVRLGGVRALAVVVMIILAAGLVAGVIGYIRLARLLASTIIAGSALALALFAYIRVLEGVVGFSFGAWPLRLLQMVRHHRELLERRIYRFLIWLAGMVWLMRVLDYNGFLEPALSFGKAILTTKLERGSISISLEDVLAFFLTVWASYLLSRFIRFILQEDVYPRIGIARGLSYAISSLLNYVIIALGFVVGMGLLGVNLSKVTVLAGAFGVGIGFGLQSIVNNFVSGLILLFERPIHVGDIVEIGDLQGEVKRIGIRSSVVRTWVGSDIIVPNSQLVSEQVTNWTLSDELRRIDLPVGVNYGADPQNVIEVMEAVAKAHPGVLQQPAPRGLFVGYGDSSINFELRAWTDQFASWYQIRSDLTVALYKAVKEAGISFPFPQREVRLLGDANAGPTRDHEVGTLEGRVEPAPGKKGEAGGPGGAK